VRAEALAVGIALVAGSCTRSPAGAAEGVAAVPEPWVAPHAPIAACSAADIAGYLAACLKEASALPIRCQQFVANHVACAECLAPASAARGAGAVLQRQGRVDLNVGGCIAIRLHDPRTEGCGAREQAARDCAAAACRPSADPNRAAPGDCPTLARQTICSAEQLRTCPELGVAASCALDRGTDEDFDASYRRLATVFCGAAG
jgi:hypothetical protein